MAANAGRCQTSKRTDAGIGTSLFPGRGFGVNRQCRCLQMAEYLQTHPAILPQQRDSALYHNREQVLLQTRRCEGVTRPMHDEGEIAMAEDKILCDNSVITRDTPEYKELIATMRNTVQVADRFMKEVRPCLLNERYFTGKQVMDLFHISRRALQNYRDKGIIPFVSIGGNILYSESKIREMLEKNYYKQLLK